MERYMRPGPTKASSNRIRFIRSFIIPSRKELMKMARQFSAKRPENLKGTICKLLGYMGNHKFLFLLVALLTTVSA